MVVVAFFMVVPGPVPLDGFVHVVDLARHDGVDAANAGSLPFGQEVNPGLHGAVAVGLGHCIVGKA
jgi:hypothetical protein